MIEQIDKKSQLSQQIKKLQRNYDIDREGET